MRNGAQPGTTHSCIFAKISCKQICTKSLKTSKVAVWMRSLWTGSHVSQLPFGDFLVFRRHYTDLSASPGSLFHCVTPDALLKCLALLSLFLFSTVLLSQRWLCFSHT
ncbi:uncharacterized protein LJ206_018477 [Theristicus caerulescens]